GERALPVSLMRSHLRYPVHLYLLIRPPPTSTLFPTRRSSDLFMTASDVPVRTSLVCSSCSSAGFDGSGQASRSAMPASTADPVTHSAPTPGRESLRS